MKKKCFTIAIVEDNKSYLNLLSMFLERMAENEEFDIKMFFFDNPVDFKVNRERFDVVILDYVFRKYTYGANGFYLAKHRKERDPSTHVIIHSSYLNEEVEIMRKDFARYYDSYFHKGNSTSTEESGLVKSVRDFLRKKM
jgi:DNA-binding NtrC family response regulator